MDQLGEIVVEELQDALNDVDSTKQIQRLLAAIAYKNGVTQTDLAEWHATGRRTIYRWLMRFDTDDPLAQAASDAHRTWRKRKLSKS
jgi:transposase